MDHQHGNQPSSSTKIQRRVIEKNRRNQMKNLYSKLNSLLPNYHSQEALPLPDQIDEAINYIKSLETKVKKMAQEKKEILMGRKRPRCGTLNSPKLEIHEMGSSLEVILDCEFDKQFIFKEIIRILHEENIEVISANSSLAGNSVLHVVHAKIRQSFFQFGATKVSERLKRLVTGSVSDVETETELWDFEIGSETCGLLDPMVNNGLPILL
ncbi:transcription factor bHLH162-like [Gastrolobium bilobum]|uniref:transcription factor bHLH162-like n=1 Tax=Gastrolobium bilobum TaxID=150636 RepID=UPI002AB08B40|nr:transcription factor bHLH162-like [Gastrolobium bilobum]